MSLTTEALFDEKENQWIFMPDGEIDIYTSTNFKEDVLKKFKDNKTNILIDGTKLKYIDSTGLGVLIFILKKLKDEDYKIYLSNIKPNIRKLFDITELDKLFIIRGELGE